MNFFKKQFNLKKINNINTNSSFKFKPKQLIIGLGLGLGVAIAGVSLADNNTSSNELQTVMTDEAIQKNAQNCASGAAGGLGDAIKKAGEIHVKMASITAPVDELFRDADCFSKLNQLIDLSIAIPSLASIMQAAIGILTDFAKRQVCQAVKKGTGQLIDPINKGIGQLNQYGNYFNDEANLGLQNLDRALGDDFISTPPPATYLKISDAQATFSTEGPSTTNINNQSSGAPQAYNGQITGNMTQQFLSNQSELMNLNPRLSNLESQLNTCRNGEAQNCTQIETDYRQILSKRDQIQGQQSLIQSQLGSASGNIINQNANLNSTTLLTTKTVTTQAGNFQNQENAANSTENNATQKTASTFMQLYAKP